MISIDIETFDGEGSALNWNTGKLLGVSVADKNSTQFVFNDETYPPVWKEHFANEDLAKVGHNIKFDMHFMAKYGMPVMGKIHDTVVLARLWNENLPTYKLKALCASIFGAKDAEDMEVLNNWLTENKLGMGDLDKAPRELVAKYGANDPAITLKLYDFLRAELTKDGIPDSLIDLESFIVRIAYEMEHEGACIDKPFLEGYKVRLEAEQAQAYQKLEEIVGHPFNPKSADEVEAIMKGLGWTPPKRKEGMKKDRDSVDKSALKGFDHPFTAAMLEYRRISTILQTFVVGILEREVGGKVHCSYNVGGTETGRWSSSQPNLQNVDKKSEARKAFIPKEGHELWFFDYKQIEPCIFAHFVGSKRLNEAFQQGLDFHTFNAAMAYKIPLESVTPAQRTVAKGLGLALMYQAGKGKAAQMMGLPFAEGVRIFESFHKNMPEVKAFVKKVSEALLGRAKQLAIDHGRLVHKLGQWHYDGKPLMEKWVNKADTKKNVLLPVGEEPENAKGWWGPFQDWDVVEEPGWIKDPFGRKHRLQMKDSYKALNRLVQGTAANVLKIGMARAVRKVGHWPLFQVHDELVFQFPIGEGEALAKVVKERMESVQEFFPNIPIRVDVAKSATNWAEETEVKL